MMKKRQIVLSVVLLLVALGSSGSQFAQDARPGADKSESRGRNQLLALGFVRTISTAEAANFAQYGSYASWQTLLAHESQYLNGWVANYYSENPSARFGDLPEILPGLSLRLNVHADGRGYDVLLEDLSDKNGYAVVSDQRGLIRECKPLR
jgi:hypothetical protein